MDIYQINDWADLAGKTNLFHRGKWIFRGVNNGHHKLIPKIGRAIALRRIIEVFGLRGDEESKIHFNFEAEKNLLSQFKRVARPHISFEPKYDIEWLAVAQHHGLPTRFLDWTTSPFVAAYFAVRNDPREDPKKEETPPESALGALGGRGWRAPSYFPGCIYALPAPAEINSGHEQNPFSISDETQPRLYHPPHLSPRVTVQNAVLTLHNTPDSPWEPSELMKLEIPGGKFAEIKSALNGIGVNESSLFPDLDGIGRHLGWLFEQNSI